MSSAIVTTSWDDGHPLDMKLAEMLGKYEVPATFFIPVRNSEGREVLGRDEIRRISETFGIGGHTYNHVDLTKVPLEEARREVVSGKGALEEMTGKELKAFCYPMGRYNKDISRIVEEAGFSCARTVRLLETRKGDPFQMGTTVHVTEKGLTHVTNYFLKSRDLPNKGMVCKLIGNGAMLMDWHRIAESALDYIVRNGGNFHLWGHSWEIEQFGAWEGLDMFLGRIRELEETGLLKTATLLGGAE